MEMENTFGNDSADLRIHFQVIKERHNITHMGIDRFEAIWKAFTPETPELRVITDLLSVNFNT